MTLNPPPGSHVFLSKVFLVGAGPGDPQYLTLRGLEALRQAEVILVDALLESSFAAYFPPEALVLDVGKREGHWSATQAEIHALMLHHARVGRRVVRLKGGDPLVFGRGGEEAQALAEAGIHFEIVPGVSAVQAAAAAAGVPLTHRGLARSLTLVEGQHPELLRDTLPLLAAGGTVAVYMGVRKLQELAWTLLEAGAPPDLPFLLVERALRPGQVCQPTTLALAAAGALGPRTPGPGLLLLGRALSIPFPALNHEVAHVHVAPLP